MLIELDPVDRITTDAVGEPGKRVFYVQARKGDHLVTVLVDKQQVQLLAAAVVEILARIGKETGEGPGEELMDLEDPIEPEWRVRRLSIGYEEARDLLVLEMVELLPEAEGRYGDEGRGEQGDEARGLEAAVGPELVVGIEELREESPEAPFDDEEDGEGADVARDSEETPDDLDELVGLEALGDPDSPEQAGGREPDRVRLWATREQMLALARHGAAVSARGRPRCPFCANPMDPEGHVCPAANGHRPGSA